MTYEEQYLALMKKTLEEGEHVEDRTGTGCYSLFGETMKVDLQKGFPLLTTKKVNFSNVVGELLWFLSGKTDLPSLRNYSDKPKGSHTIWSDDAKKFWDTTKTGWVYEKNQCLGYIYSRQWRDFESWNGFELVKHDQLGVLLDNLEEVKNGDLTTARRLRVSSWHPYDHTVGDKEWCALPACHTDFQVIVRGDKLHLAFSMRSNDLFLGNPYNIASYALLAHILAQLCNLKVGFLFYSCVDAHLYSNHLEQIKEQMSRKPYEMPTLVMPEFTSLSELLKLTAKDFKLDNYKHHPFIKAPQAS